MPRPINPDGPPSWAHNCTSCVSAWLEATQSERDLVWEHEIALQSWCEGHPSRRLVENLFRQADVFAQEMLDSQMENLTASELGDQVEQLMETIQQQMAEDEEREDAASSVQDALARVRFEDDEPTLDEDPFPQTPTDAFAAADALAEARRINNLIRDNNERGASTVPTPAPDDTLNMHTRPEPVRSPFVNWRNNRPVNPACLEGTNYPHDRCACSACVIEFVRGRRRSTSTANAVYQRGLYLENEFSRYWNRTVNSAEYVWEALNRNQRALVEQRRYSHDQSQRSSREQARAQAARERWAGRTETRLHPTQAQVLNEPLRWIVKKGGRVWSAEVEVNGVTPNVAARGLGVTQGSYSTRPDQPCVIASSDVTVDAEIKVSCIRDGSKIQATMAHAAYTGLVRLGAFCATNAGHHVHIDGTRIADQGAEVCQDVITAAAMVGRACSPALIALSSSGYNTHRYMGQRGGAFPQGEGNWRSRTDFHGCRLVNAAHNDPSYCATVEYRLPNGTIEPVRAHAYVAVGMGLLDLAERAVVDLEPQAMDFVRMCQDRIRHAGSFDEAQAAQMLADALLLTRDSTTALAISAWTSPASAAHREVWRTAAPNLSVQTLQLTGEAVIPANADLDADPGDEYDPDYDDDYDGEDREDY